MAEKSGYQTLHAIQDFRAARQREILNEIITRLKGESSELLAFDEVRQMLKAQIGSKQVLKEIPIDAIIGSVNRYQDFSRGFLPRKNINEERWANVEVANQELAGLPPIEVYQVGEVYFVSDGNHRVSVARQSGSSLIQAYVTDVHIRVPLTTDTQPEDLILKSEYAEFIEQTNIDQMRPEADLTVTVPGQYPILYEHIAVHRYYMGIEQEREIARPEAAADWYDRVYLPVVSIIRERGLLMDFPNRTEADLYLWISDHRAVLEDSIKSQVEMIDAAADLADQYSHRPGKVLSRLGMKIIKAIVPDNLESGPPAGEWRQAVLSGRRERHLFCEILVPLSGTDESWQALNQAIVIAKKEETGVHGLTILADDAEGDSDLASVIQQEFARRCELEGVKGELQIRIGDITNNICELARWNDLVVLNMTFPPEETAISRLTSGIRNLIQRCPRPLLFTPGVSLPLSTALLVYDGSPKSQEALFIAAYLAERWKTALSVLTIGGEDEATFMQEDIAGYFQEQNIDSPTFFTAREFEGALILDYLVNNACELLLIGGYNRGPIMEIILGSALDQLLLQIQIPLIVCR